MDKQFASDVLTGLKDRPKHISSKYFYDAKGDRIFQQIMALPEYYLTRCEYSIFKKHKKSLLREFSSSGSEEFDLIELGAGDGTKTKILLEHLLKEKVGFRYYPIDISANVLKELVDDLHKLFPRLNVKGMPYEYFEALKQINEHHNGRRKVVLFLGSNIGNFDQPTAKNFLKELNNTLNPGDMVLVGMDCKKDPKVIKKAYDDTAGITKSFNLNLLERINRELKGNFQISNFNHYAVYNPETGMAQSFLLSKKDHYVEILDERIHFDAWETVHTEISQKYDRFMIDSMAENAGFSIQENFYDDKKYFVDSLWIKK